MSRIINGDNAVVLARVQRYCFRLPAREREHILTCSCNIIAETMLKCLHKCEENFLCTLSPPFSIFKSCNATFPGQVDTHPCLAEVRLMKLSMPASLKVLGARFKTTATWGGHATYAITTATLTLQEHRSSWIYTMTSCPFCNIAGK